MAETSASVLDTPGLWWLLQVSLRKEIEIAADLVGAGHACYLPVSLLTTVYASYNRRTRVVPLFPGYAFLNVGTDPEKSPEAINEALRLKRLGRGVMAVIPVNHAIRLHRELRAIEAALFENPELAAQKLEVGQTCRVTDGPFRDHIGQLIEAGKRFLLPVHVLGQAVPIEIPLEWLEPV